MVFGVGSEDPPTIPGVGVVDDQGNYVPPVTGTPAQAAASGASNPENNTRPINWNTNDTPVKMGLTAGGGQYPVNQVLPFYEAALYPFRLRGLARSGSPDEYTRFVKDLRKYTNQKLGTTTAVNEAWEDVLVDAQQAGVNALSLLGTGDPDGSDGGSGRGGYSGPRASVVKQAESDINATANALALEMIGRPLNQKELNRITKRIRAAEVEQPTISTGGKAMTVQQQGLTAQGREDILREVIAKRPEFEKFQLDTTVMDAMNAYVQEKRAVIDV